MHKPLSDAERDLHERLFWTKPADLAADIIAGKDRATNTDVARRRTLGRTVREP